MDVGVIGGSGYGGAELLRLLVGHPAFKLRVVAGSRASGRRVGDVFPQLLATGLADHHVVEATPDELADCQVVFSATPHAVSMELLPLLLAEDRIVVDLSGAFRLPADAYPTWYGMAHTAAELTPAAYGLPELWRDDLVGAGLIAGPGCYPTAALLALAPLADLADDGAVTVTGMSGWSGAGRSLRDDLHASHAVGNVAPYGAPAHRHTPEIAQQYAELGGRDVRLAFVPHLVPMARGEVVTCTVPLIDGVAAGDVHESAATRYADEPFVVVLEPGRWPESTHVAGANTAQIAYAVDDRAGVAVASCTIDNLVKGGAGQAIQAANVATGTAETAGLPTAGLYP
ncbi:MAG TPA: N-acetyl-gamma-glutamyl-phosphate reductase [Euzebyales bacterium]|nr:N-acetyl-gamma-glutamyl-phosphate reductase [Euzebyales bacterium]